MLASFSTSSLACFVAVVLLASPASGQTLDFERYDRFCSMSNRERALFSDMEDGQLDAHTLVEAALIAAGRSDAEAVQLQRQLAGRIRRFRSQIQAKHVPRIDIPKEVFRKMRREYLHGLYKPELYDVGSTLRSGTFNCLTATLLYHAICQEFGIAVHARWEPSHVCCWVPTSGDSNTGSGYLVETTSEGEGDAFGQVQSVSQLTDRGLTRVELIAKVLYNRGVACLQDHRYETALVMTWSAFLLDPNDDPAFNNLRACFNNWALTACEQDNKTLADELFRAGLKLDPDYAPFLRNRTLLIGR